MHHDAGWLRGALPQGIIKRSFSHTHVKTHILSFPYGLHERVKTMMKQKAMPVHL